MSVRNRLWSASESLFRVPPLLLIDEVFRTSFGFGGPPFGLSLLPSAASTAPHSPSPTRELFTWALDYLQNQTQQGSSLLFHPNQSDELYSSLQDLSLLTEEVFRNASLLLQVAFSLTLFFAALVVFMLSSENLGRLYLEALSLGTLVGSFFLPPLRLPSSFLDLILLSMNLTGRTCLGALFFFCRRWRGEVGIRLKLDFPLLSLFFLPSLLGFGGGAFGFLVLLLHYPLLHQVPSIYRFLLSSWGETKRVQNEYGLSHLLQVESARLRLNTVFRLFWLTRAVYEGLVRCCAEPLSAIIRAVMVQGTETFTGIVGLTVTVAAVCHQIGDLLLWLLYLGGNSEIDLNRFGSISTVLFFILSLQSGLTSLDPEKRLDRLMKNVALLGTALFHALHQLVAPLLHAFRSFQPVQVRAAVLSLAFLLLSVCLTVSLLKWAAISTWSLAVLALAIEFKIKVVISLVISLVVYLSQLVEYPEGVDRLLAALRSLLPSRLHHFLHRCYDQVSHEDMVFYLKTVANAAEFITGIFLFLNAVWIFLFESTSAIRAIGMSIHAYFNIWCEGQKGIRIYLQRKTASKKIESLLDASEDQLRLRSDDVCSICYESFESAKVTNCGHLFHAVCLRKWLYVQNTCPMCHEILYKEDGEDGEGSGGEEEEMVEEEREGNPDTMEMEEDESFVQLEAEEEVNAPAPGQEPRHNPPPNHENNNGPEGRGLVLFL